MKIFGYDKTTNESELLEMREVTFRANPDTLRAIAEFLNKSAELIEERGFALFAFLWILRYM